jgi:hypothetical protein
LLVSSYLSPSFFFFYFYFYTFFFVFFVFVFFFSLSNSERKWSLFLSLNASGPSIQFLTSGALGRYWMEMALDGSVVVNSAML